MFKESKTFILLLLLSIFTILLAYSSLLSMKIQCYELGQFHIPVNSTANDVALKLHNQSCVNSTLFKIAIILTFNQKNIRPGKYNLNGVSNIHDLLRVITSSKVNRTKFTLIEGWTINQVAKILSDKLRIDKNIFIKLCKSQKFINSLGLANYTSLEGFLFPDTYWLLDSYSEEDIIRIFVNRFKDIYNSKIYPNVSNANFSTSDIITLASIIQSEAMYKDEMPIISKVYHNRLDKNMKLEADPTVIYFMSYDDQKKFKSNRKIFRKYKDVNNPYNTYFHKGLPQGPINNPGLDAMLSAINPIDTNLVLLYFVADGKGRHIFSENLTNHKKAINKVRYGF